MTHDGRVAPRKSHLQLSSSAPASCTPERGLEVSWTMSSWPSSSYDPDPDRPWASSEASLLLPVLPQDDLFDGLVASWTQSPFAAAANNVQIKSEPSLGLLTAGR